MLSFVIQLYKTIEFLTLITTQYIFIWNDLRHIRFHDLRHSCASILLSKGFTLKDVQERLGHTNITLTTADTYGHLDMERKKDIAAAMGKLISYLLDKC